MNNFQIETITPVHVGNGSFIQKDTEYILKEDKILVISPEKFMRAIGPDRIEDWLSRIERGLSIEPMLSGIIPHASMVDVCSRIILNKSGTGVILPNLKENIHSGTGVPYIPGSSIKGSIRSAILASLIREKHKKVPFDWIQNDRGRLSSEILEDSFFGKDPKNDVFRFLRIGDAYFGENSTISIRMGNINMKGDSVRLDFSKQQQTEAIGAGNKTVASIRIDTLGMTRNEHYQQIDQAPAYFSDLKTLSTLLNNNTALILEQEINFWDNYDDVDVTDYINILVDIHERIMKLKPGGCIIRVGHGMGWTFLSGSWMKDPRLFDPNDFEEAMGSIRPKNYQYKQYPFPKTRRTSKEFDLLGFVELTPIEDRIRSS